MKTKLLYLIVTLILPLLTFGDDQAHEVFAKANALYAGAHYKEALTTYKKLANEGYQSAALFFDMGNASYKLGDIPSAVLYFEKAHKLSPGDDDINFNLQLANLRTTDKVEEPPSFFLSRWWQGFILAISANSLAIISIALFFTGSAMLILYFFANVVLIKKAFFISAIVLFALGITAIFIANRQINYFDNHRQAIIFSSAVTVKSGPVEKSNPLFVIHQGTKVNIRDDNNGWLKIRLANGTEGWIKTSDVKEI